MTLSIIFLLLCSWFGHFETLHDINSSLPLDDVKEACRNVIRRVMIKMEEKTNPQPPPPQQVSNEEKQDNNEPIIENKTDGIDTLIVDPSNVTLSTESIPTFTLTE